MLYPRRFFGTKTILCLYWNCLKCAEIKRFFRIFLFDVHDSPEVCLFSYLVISMYISQICAADIQQVCPLFNLFFDTNSEKIDTISKCRR